MTMETDLTTYVLAQSAITALIGTRFEPVLNVQSQTLPAVSYQVISAPAGYTHDGLAMTAWRVQLTVTDLTYAGLVAVANALRAALAGVVWTGTGERYSSFVENVLDGLAPPAGQAGFYLRRMDVVIEN